MADRYTTRSSSTSSLFKKSTLALCIAAITSQGYAQTESDASTDSPAALEEVVVYGVKQSLESAQELRREAATVTDVITASDIGALPDKSVVEALQRVPGVAIERFEASSDPDHFAVEGGGVVVRGLNRVRSEFNGRDAFSAGQDGGLNFSDIPPELVGRVEVSKNQTADMTEGGVAGTINLVTRKPLDNDGLTLGANIRASYGDLVDDVTPSLSLIGSNTWDTDSFGRFGALLSLSGSNFTSRGDSVGVYNFFERPFDGPEVAGEVLALPIAGSARQQFNDRDRLGLAGSLQWESPSEEIVATLEFIRSEATYAWNERVIEYPNQPFSPDAAASLAGMGLEDYVFECFGESTSANPCQFRSGTIIGGTYPWAVTPYITGTRAHDEERAINDLSFDVVFTPTDNLTLWADLQYVKATNDIQDNTVQAKFFSDVSLAFEDDSADFELLNPAVADPASYFFRSAMDHVSANEGDQKALAFDAEYTFDQGWVTGVKTGVRFSNREVTVREADYNWGNLSETWVSGVGEGNEPFFPAFVDAGLVETFTFEDHLSGNAMHSNNTLWFPSLSLAEMSAEEMYRIFEENGIRQNASGWLPNSMRPGAIPGTSFLPSEIYITEEDREAVYVRLDFASEIADMEYSGNFGLRYVTWQTHSTGADVFPSPISDDLIDPTLDPNLDQEVIDYSNGAGGATNTISGDKFSHVFPSLNLKFGLTEDVILRFAASEAMWMPTLLDLRNKRVIDGNVTAVRQDTDGDGEAETLTGAIHNGFFSNGAGNPLLQPELSVNFDVALEWYFADVGSLTTTWFHKTIDDFHRDATNTVQVTNPTVGITQPVAITQTRNAGEAELQGVELAFQATLEALGEAFAPFGVQASYTYIDGEEKSSTISAPTGDEFSFRNFTNLPIEGLSRDNYNLVVFYDQEDWQARLAYSWRSRYLMDSRDVIAFSPVYGEATGQLDGSLSYQVSDSFKVGIEANNLLDEVTKTSIQYNQEGILTPRSYFTNDRRFALFVQAVY